MVIGQPPPSDVASLEAVVFWVPQGLSWKESSRDTSLLRCEHCVSILAIRGLAFVILIDSKLAHRSPYCFAFLGIFMKIVLFGTNYAVPSDKPRASG
jgi:hypothetical protein